jgi:hypothetical protein
MSDMKRDLDFELTDEFASFITDLHASEIKAKSRGYMAEATELPSCGAPRSVTN